MNDDIEKKEKAGKNIIVRNSLVSGSLAGMASILVVYPFDVVHTKIQSTSYNSNRQKGKTFSNYSRIKSTINKTWRNGGGVRAFYTGLSLPLLAQAIYKATIFSVNNICKDVLIEFKAARRKSNDNSTTMLSSSSPSLTSMELFWCGFISGGINAAVFVTPVEYIRNQLIIEQQKILQAIKEENIEGTISKKKRSFQRRSGPIDVIRSALSSHKEGLVQLWRGIGITVARDSIGCGFYFMSMTLCQKALLTSQDSAAAAPSFGITLVSGMCAGIGFWVVALPLDTLKTWVQTNTTAKEKTHEVLMNSISKYGIRKTAQNLTHGWPVALGRGAPSAAITIATYEYCYQFMNKL